MTAFEATLVDLLSRGLTVRFLARGDSMHPTIRCGEHVHVTPVTAGALRVGDVVLARAARGLTAHRLIRVGPSSLVTRGDNATRDDAALEPQSILGRVAAVERQGAAVSVQPAPAWVRVLARRAGRQVLSFSRSLRGSL